MKNHPLLSGVTLGAVLLCLASVVFWSRPASGQDPKPVPSLPPGPAKVAEADPAPASLPPQEAPGVSPSSVPPPSGRVDTAGSWAPPSPPAPASVPLIPPVASSIALPAAPAQPQINMKAATIEDLLNRLQTLRAQKAELDRQEKELVTILVGKLKEQKERIQKLGIKGEEIPYSVPLQKK